MKPCMPSSLRSPNTRYGRSKCLADTTPSSRVSPSRSSSPQVSMALGDKDYLIALQSIARGINAMSGLRKQYLTFVYGGDVARAALFVLRDERARGQRYIVADGDTYTDREFGHLAQRLLGRKHVFHIRIPPATGAPHLPLRLAPSSYHGGRRRHSIGTSTRSSHSATGAAIPHHSSLWASPRARTLRKGFARPRRRAPPRSPPIVHRPRIALPHSRAGKHCSLFNCGNGGFCVSLRRFLRIV